MLRTRFNARTAAATLGVATMALIAFAVIAIQSGLFTNSLSQQSAAVAQSGTMPVSIVPTITKGPAPLGVFFRAEGLPGSDAQVEDLILHSEFEWDFKNYYEYTALPPEANVPREAGRARGQFAAHVFDTPGTYNVELTARTQDGRTGKATVRITVEDPDVVYAGDKTAVVSINGDFRGAPAGARQFTDVFAAAEYVISKTDRDSVMPDMRLLFRAGEEILVDDFDREMIVIRQALIDKFGEGPNPKFTLTTNSLGGHALFNLVGSLSEPYMIMANIDYTSAFDPTNPFDTQPYAGELFTEKGNFRFVFHNVNLKNVKSGFDVKDKFAIISNSSVQDWRTYGIMRHGTGAVIGSSIRQNPNTDLSRAGKRGNEIAFHGPYRTSFLNSLVISRSYFESHSGWSRGLKNTIAIQPALRLGTSGRASKTDSYVRAYIGESHMKGGNGVVSSNPAIGSRMANKGLIVIANNFIEGTKTTGSIFGTSYGSIAFRNNIGYIPKSTEAGMPVARQMTTFKFNEWQTISPEIVNGSHNYYNNTFTFFLDKPLRHAAGFNVIEKPATLTNNLVFAPYATDEAGPRVNFQPLNSAFSPLPGNPVIGAASGRTALIDFYGNPRPARASIGAVEPGANSTWARRDLITGTISSDAQPKVPSTPVDNQDQDDGSGDTSSGSGVVDQPSGSTDDGSLTQAPIPIKQGSVGNTSGIFARIDDVNQNGKSDREECSIAVMRSQNINDDRSFKALETDVRNGCVEKANNILESDLYDDEAFDFPLGLIDFEVKGKRGATHTITTTFNGNYDTSKWVYRKFINGEYIDISEKVTYTKEKVDRNYITRATYQVRDGGPLDADGVANGIVVDPAGPAILAEESNTPSIGNNDENQSSDDNQSSTDSSEDTQQVKENEQALDGDVDAFTDEEYDAAESSTSNSTRTNRSRSSNSNRDTAPTFSYSFDNNISFVQPQFNDPTDVRSLAQFLNDYEGESLAIDGTYSSEDIAAVQRFQRKYRREILDVWNLTEATGFVGITTRLKMNFLMKGQTAQCPAFTEYNGGRSGIMNSAEIGRTQQILRDLDMYNGPINNTWDAATNQALIVFQETFREVMLDPWNITEGTGYKYKTTNKFLNYFAGCDTGSVFLEGVGEYEGL